MPLALPAIWHIPDPPASSGVSIPFRTADTHLGSWKTPAASALARKDELFSGNFNSHDLNVRQSGNRSSKELQSEQLPKKKESPSLRGAELELGVAEQATCELPVYDLGHKAVHGGVMP